MTSGHCAVSLRNPESSGARTKGEARREGTGKIGETAERAVAGDVDEDVGDGDEEQVGRDGDRVGERAVEQAENAFDVRVVQPVVRQEDELLEAQQRPDVELRHVAPEQIRVAHVALATPHRAPPPPLDDLAQQRQRLQVPLAEVHAAHQPQHRAEVLQHARRQFSAADLPRRRLQRGVAQLPHLARAAPVHRRERQQLPQQQQRAAQHAARLAAVLHRARGDLHEVPRGLVHQLALPGLALVRLQHVAFFLQKLRRRVARLQDRVAIRAQHQRQHELQQLRQRGRVGAVCASAPTPSPTPVVLQQVVQRHAPDLRQLEVAARRGLRARELHEAPQKAHKVELRVEGDR